MCPKCRKGTLSPVTLGSSNWTCNVCGYTEYHSNRASVDTSSSRSRMNSAVSGFNDAVDELHRANRAMDSISSSSRSGEKSGKGGWGIVVVVAIIVFILLSNG